MIYCFDFTIYKPENKYSKYAYQKWRWRNKNLLIYLDSTDLANIMKQKCLTDAELIDIKARTECNRKQNSNI